MVDTGGGDGHGVMSWRRKGMTMSDIDHALGEAEESTDETTAEGVKEEEDDESTAPTAIDEAAEEMVANIEWFGRRIWPFQRLLLGLGGYRDGTAQYSAPWSGKRWQTYFHYCSSPVPAANGCIGC